MSNHVFDLHLFVAFANDGRIVCELTGVEFIDENGGGPGVRLRKRQRAKQPK
jgi:hypothetical protein